MQVFKANGLRGKEIESGDYQSRFLPCPGAQYLDGFFFRGGRGCYMHSACGARRAVILQVGNENGVGVCQL